MTAFDYAGAVATANALIADFGQAGALVRAGAATGPAYNPTPGAPVDHACTFVVDSFRKDEVDGTSVLQTDLKVLLAQGSLAIEPATSDKLKVAGKPIDILKVEPLAPGGVTVFWTLQCRR